LSLASKRLCLEKVNRSAASVINTSGAVVFETFVDVNDEKYVNVFFTRDQE
jgi:hypothetical protein